MNATYRRDYLYNIEAHQGIYSRALYIKYTRKDDSYNFMLTDIFGNANGIIVKVPRTKHFVADKTYWIGYDRTDRLKRGGL